MMNVNFFFSDLRELTYQQKRVRHNVSVLFGIHKLNTYIKKKKEIKSITTK